MGWMISLTAAVAAVATAQPPSAPFELASLSTGDLQCAAFNLALSEQTPDKADRATYLVTAYYYIGRVQGREPRLDWMAGVAAESRNLNKLQTGEMDALMNRCVRDVNATASALKG